MKSFVNRVADPRDQFIAPAFQEGVRELADVQPDMILEGVVTNVTKFGAFVDIGVHQDGLVHISELSNRFIKDPSEAVKAGQIVKVKVLSADLLTRRIALSMKALLPSATPRPMTRSTPRQTPRAEAPHPGKPRVMPGRQPARTAAPQLTMTDKLDALSSRWKVTP